MEGYRVEPIKSSVGKEFIRTHHYSRGSHNGPICYGLFDAADLIGVLAFATPNSENVRGSVFGHEHVSRVTELHRLVILDDTPCNTESWFISRVLKMHKAGRGKDLWAVVSFADSTEGHLGVIYQATNAIYYGMSAPATFYMDQDGRLRHPRQQGVNITRKEAESRGWTAVKRQAKHRYCYLLGSSTDRKVHREMLKITPQPYPKENHES